MLFCGGGWTGSSAKKEEGSNFVSIVETLQILRIDEMTFGLWMRIALERVFVC